MGGAHPVEPATVERDHEPGTRFLVVEIPPEATEVETDFVSESVVEAAHRAEEVLTNRQWDLFVYRQHNAPPANVPALPATGVSDEAVEKAAHAMYADNEVGEWEDGELDTLLQYRRAARIAVEAALPHLQPQPVASREALAKAVEAGAVAIDVAKYFRVGDMERFVSALLAAGVFRDEADVLCSCFVISDVNDNCPQHGRDS